MAGFEGLSPQVVLGAQIAVFIGHSLVSHLPSGLPHTARDGLTFLSPSLPLISSLQIFLAVVCLARIVQSILLPRLLNAANFFSESTLDDKAVAIVEEELHPAPGAGLLPAAAKASHLYIALFIASKPLGIAVLDRFEPVAFFWALLWWRALTIVWRLFHLLCSEALPNSNFARQQQIGAGDIETILRVARIIYWSVSALFVAENVGLEVGSLIASAGIGGVAVALSAQQVLQDILAALTMLLDHTVSNGDFVVLAGGGDVSGSVISRGWKSTRLRSPSGQMHVIANRDICSARIQSFAPTQDRREVFCVRLDIRTEAGALEGVVPALSAVVASVDGAELQACYLREFEADAIVFDLYVGFQATTLDEYRQLVHTVNMGIARTLTEKKLRRAVPYKVQLDQ